MAQYHLVSCRSIPRIPATELLQIEFTIVLLRLLHKMEELDQSRPRPSFFYPHPDRLITHFWRSIKDKHLGDDTEQIDGSEPRKHCVI